MTLVSLTGDVIRYTRTVLIRQTGGGKRVFVWNEHRLLFRLSLTVMIKIENTEICFCKIVHVTVTCNMQLTINKQKSCATRIGPRD